MVESLIPKFSTATIKAYAARYVANVPYDDGFKDRATIRLAAKLTGMIRVAWTDVHQAPRNACFCKVAGSVSDAGSTRTGSDSLTSER
ncbi:MAG: hypothetical protein JWM76_5131 [Pseudonocardiales bacterium]|nr:hypothetical protein [Pseudonocardiales bacterium]